MDFWTLLFTGIGSALGGTATALAIVAFFGNKIFDYWFKKANANYETDLKKDFKHFELKLDAIASKEDTRYSYLHPKRAEAAVKIFELCRRLTIAFDTYMIALKNSGEMLHTPEARKERFDYKRSVDGLLSDASNATQDNLLYFDEPTLAAIANCINYVWKLSAIESASEKETLVDIERNARERLEKLKSHFKGLLDSDK